MITLENEAVDELKEQDIPLKREGMLSSFDLRCLLGKTDVFYTKQLQKYYDENRTFEVDGVQYPLVEKVKSGGRITLALHEHPNALETFKQLLAQDGIVLKERKIIPRKQKLLLSQKRKKADKKLLIFAPKTKTH